MNWMSILSILGSICAGLVAIFQVIKTWVNNRKFNRFAKKVANQFTILDIVNHLDYQKIAELVVIELDKKINKKDEVKN